MRNQDHGQKRTKKISSMDKSRKILKTNLKTKDLELLFPEKMSAEEICFALQERGVDIEDVRCLLVYRLKKFMRENKESSKVINAKEEFNVDEESSEDMEINVERETKKKQNYEKVFQKQL